MVTFNFAFGSILIKNIKSYTHLVRELEQCVYLVTIEAAVSYLGSSLAQ